MSNKKAQIKKLKERLMEGMQALERGDMDAYESNYLPPLLPDRHPDRDFFVCDILDTAPKDDLGSMEHPMFSLATKPDHKIRTYQHNGDTLIIAPGAVPSPVLVGCLWGLFPGAFRADQSDRLSQRNKHYYN